MTVKVIVCASKGHANHWMRKHPRLATSKPVIVTSVDTCYPIQDIDLRESEVLWLDDPAVTRQDLHIINDMLQQHIDASFDCQPRRRKVRKSDVEPGVDLRAQSRVEQLARISLCYSATPQQRRRWRRLPT